MEWLFAVTLAAFRSLAHRSPVPVSVYLAELADPAMFISPVPVRLMLRLTVLIEFNSMSPVPNRPRVLVDACTLLRSMSPVPTLLAINSVHTTEFTSMSPVPLLTASSRLHSIVGPSMSPVPLVVSFNVPFVSKAFLNSMSPVPLETNSLTDGAEILAVIRYFPEKLGVRNLSQFKLSLRPFFDVVTFTNCIRFSGAVISTFVNPLVCVNSTSIMELLVIVSNPFRLNDLVT